MSRPTGSVKKEPSSLSVCGGEELLEEDSRDLIVSHMSCELQVAELDKLLVLSADAELMFKSPN